MEPDEEGIIEYRGDRLAMVVIPRLVFSYMLELLVTKRNACSAWKVDRVLHRDAPRHQTLFIEEVIGHLLAIEQRNKKQAALAATVYDNKGRLLLTEEDWSAKL
jgi:hypothetical protein